MTSEPARAAAAAAGPRAAVAAATAAVLALAAALVAAPPTRGAEADLNLGRAVVVGAGLQQGGVPCLSCHGMDGAGDGTGAFPRLTGQSAWYTYKQLKDYASGERQNAIMTPIAKALTDEQMEAAAAYYAAQSAPYPPQPEVDGRTLQHGAALSAVGNAERAIQACVNCHGPAGTGMPPTYPYLAGQYAEYLELALKAYKSGERHNDPLAVMRTIAGLMTDEDIRAVSLYLESVRPPSVGNLAPAAAAQAPGPGPGAR